MFKKIGVITKPNDSRVSQSVRTIKSLLDMRGISMCVAENVDAPQDECTQEAKKLRQIANESDLIIVLGGDGTLLHAARAVMSEETGILGINLGRIGFLTDIAANDIETRLARVLDGHYTEEKRFAISTHILRQGQTIHAGDSLNDVVLHKGRIARLFPFETWINGVFVNSQRSDGLIVSTPTGSTAYALSGGGPIIHPTLNAILMVPICPHTLSNRPIVVHGSSNIEIRLADFQDETVQVTCDGFTELPLCSGDIIQISRKRPQVKLIHPDDHDYYAGLRSKLHWGTAL